MPLLAASYNIDMSEKAQAFYKNDAKSLELVRPRFQDRIEDARKYYKKYVEFVEKNLPRKNGKILDIGCGEGWSTFLLKERGYYATGMDLQDGTIEAKSVDPNLIYVSGDARKMPMGENTFDGVAMYQVLGHIPEPKETLEECIRVLKPGGRLIIVGPNLISFVFNGYWSMRHTLRCLSEGKVWEKRTDDLPSHPGGNTMPESWYFTFLFAYKTIRKLLGENPVQFWMREPDIAPPFFANNDTCYYSNPMDLINWAKQRSDVKVIRWRANDSLLWRLTWFLRGGMWVVLEKVES